MNCEACIALIVDAAERTINAADRHALNAHVAGCEACRAALAEFESASPVIELLRTETGSAHASVSFDDNVRRAVAEAAAAKGRRGVMWWVPRLAATAVAIALAVMALHSVIQDRRTAPGLVSDETLLSLFDPSSAYEPGTRDEAAALEEEMFSEAFKKSDLEEIDRALNGDIEDQIFELDDASLKTFEEALEETLSGLKKSG